MPTPPASSADRLGRGSRLLPFLVLALGLALTLLVWKWVAEQLERTAALRFERTKDLVTTASAQQFRSLEQALTAGRSLIESTPGMTHAQWRSYSEAVAPFLDRGVLGIGYVDRIERGRLDYLEGKVRADGMPQFRIERTGTAPYAAIVTYMEPRERNASALGLDISDGTHRIAAAEEAMRTGKPAITTRINVISGTRNVPGCLLFLPVFTPGPIPAEEAERLARLRGWVYASIEVGELLKGVAAAAPAGTVEVEVFEQAADGGAPIPLSESDGKSGLGQPAWDRVAPGMFAAETTIPVYGRHWLLRLRTTPVFQGRDPARFLWLFLGGGTVCSLFASGFTWVLVNSRRRALNLADEMTAHLREAEAESRRLALVASRTASGVILADKDWKIEWANDSFVAFFGYSAEDVKGKHPREILHGPETSRETVEMINRASEAGQPFKGEILNYTKNGEPRWIELDIQPLKDEKGAITGYAGLHLDVTEHKRVQREIARQEARFRFIFELVPVGLAWQRVGRDESRLVNSAFARIAGLPSAGGDTVGAVVHPADEAREAELTAKLNRGEIDHFTVEQRFAHPDGRTIWVVLTIRNFRDPASGEMQQVATLVDITELKQQADELRTAMESAERASVAKSQFLAMISHEIRTPMNGVIGMTSLLLDSPLSKEQQDFVETIRSSGDTLLTIINDLLDFSKIESGRLEFEQEDFALRDSIEATLDLLAPRFAEKRIDLLYEIADGVPGTVRGDATRLRQILVNLLGNALKFTAKGEVVLSVHAKPARDEGMELAFAVRDTGIGIPPEGMQRLFQSFSQVDASTTRRFGGTGLGLAISKRLAELMGGTMWVESVVGRGSTFHFTIRIDAVAGKPRPYFSATAGTHQLQDKRVLIVDDNATNRRILTALVEGWGMRQAAAATAAEALALLEAGERFDAAIVDMQMPEMDGAMFAQEVRQRFNRQPPLILLSSLGHHAMIEDKTLFAAYLTKPAKPAQIQASLIMILREEPHARPGTAHPLGVAADPARRAKHPERILLAEDNVVNQKVALLMLDKLGYRADLAADGLEAIEAVERQRYDVILMDVQMPEMDGIEATRRIIGRYPDRATRPTIIATTANAMQGDRERCLEAGMDDYIGKPIKMEELAAALEKARAGRART